MPKPHRMVVRLADAEFYPPERLVYAKDLTDDIAKRGLQTPVTLLATSKGFRIINGGRRIASLLVLNRMRAKNPETGKPFVSVWADVYADLTDEEIRELGVGILLTTGLAYWEIRAKLFWARRELMKKPADERHDAVVAIDAGLDALSKLSEKHGEKITVGD